ncbi:MAG: YpdA family putative bacillithiol disulfide reductase [Bacteroidetes bacterium]|nr:MAG: YpdA family putative bacillithiol disulfide reductase [Bacteroidota bacterium]GIV57424.1 MAG: pyridine nucleotide-disulfide oxidoreductase [Rhodothermaceae bacterium]
MLDVIIIGAGPVGLACGIEARRNGLSARIIEKGALVNSFLGYPTNMELFSTPDLLEIGGHPFPTHRYKPLREETIDYYRRVAQVERLDVRLYERVLRVEGEAGHFVVHTDRGTHASRFVVAATGFFDVPNRMDVPGEDLPKVTHYYKEPFAYTGMEVAVIGAKNSAAKAALECFRHGARVTLVVRGPAVSDSVKYWIKPDLENRIREGSIRAYFNTTVEAITERTIRLRTPEGPVELPNDFVLAMTGYRPDYTFLTEALGIAVADDPARTPVHDPETFETNRPGVYLAGTVCGGLNTSRWFIENGRFHAAQIMRHIAETATADLEG